MGQFLRDQFIRNVTIDEEALSRINDFLAQRVAATNDPEPSARGHISLSYVIRVDDKGYRFTNFQDLRKCYQEAKRVERVVFNVDSISSHESGGLRGTNLELRLDTGDLNLCRLMASADDPDWANATFAGITDLLRRQRNLSWLVQTAWTGLLVQLFGVALGFVLSLWAALKIAPHLGIENPFAVSFVFAFLVYSNIWVYLNGQILRAINFSFPNLRFRRTGRDATHWLTQAVVGGLVLAFAVYLLGKIFDLVGSVLGTFVGK